MEKIIKKIKIYSLKNNRKKILKNYYSKEMRKGKTCRANFVDKLFFNLFLFIMVLIFLIIKSEKIVLPLFISLLFIFFFSKVSTSLSNKLEDKRIKNINEELKYNKILKEFESYSRDDFVNNIKDILEEYMDIKAYDSNTPMDLKYKNSRGIVGIKCMQSSLEYKISSREVGVFIRQLKEKDIEEGIIITNSYFIDKERFKDKIILYDLDDIVQILKDIDKYPSDLDMENYIVDRFLDRRSSIKKEIRKMGTKKIINLYILAIVFFIMSYFVKYDLYYKIIALVSFVIATGIGGYNISEYIYVKAK